MHIRKKKNKSGSTSVLLIDKSGGKYRIVKNFGTTKDDKTIQQLEIQAHEYLRQLKGSELDLFDNPAKVHIHHFIGTISNSQVQVIGPELIFGTLYDRIGYGAIESKLFRHLVIARLFQPGSKLKTVDYLSRYLHVHYEVSQIYRFLDRLCEKRGKKGIKEEVERITYAYSKEVVGGRIEVVFYDLTTLYFESSEEDDLRKTGYSKDGKHQHPQIYLGLLVTTGGNALGYEIFEGNIFEGNTFIVALKRLEKKYGLKEVVVIADAGLLSKRNVMLLEEKGYRYILGARIKNSSKEIKERILSLKLKDGEFAILSKGGKKKLVISYSSIRGMKDEKNRERGLKRLRGQIMHGKLTKSHINNRGYNRFLEMDGQVKIRLNEEKIESDRKWDGLKGYETNTDLTGDAVIENYSYLWEIERAFRMNKTDLRMRPIYHRLENRIRGHICICFVAYTILLELERLLKRAQSGLTLARAREVVRNMYQITYTLEDSPKTYRKLLKMDKDQQELYNIIQNLA